RRPVGGSARRRRREPLALAGADDRLGSVSRPSRLHFNSTIDCITIAQSVHSFIWTSSRVPTLGSRGLRGESARHRRSSDNSGFSCIAGSHVCLSSTQLARGVVLVCPG